MKRLHSLDGLRGILALIVMLSHAAMLLNIFVLEWPATISVCVFFLMSGYVLTRAWDGRYAVFLVRRVVRLWPVYATCITIGYLMRASLPNWLDYLWYSIDAIGQRTAVDGPAWSLCVEMRAMLFMPVIVWCGRGPWWRLAAGYVVCAILFRYNDGHWGYGWLFLTGAALSRFQPRHAWLESRAPQFLGKISYSLYLVHPLVLEVCVAIFGRNGVFLGVPACVLFAWELWRVVEAPSIAWSRRIGGRVEPATPAPLAAALPGQA